MSPAILLLLTTLEASTAPLAPDLCADVYLKSNGDPVTDLVGQTVSRFCGWTGPAAPVWGTDLCCAIDGQHANCGPTSSAGRCGSGMKMFCEYGELLEDGTVACYQPFPAAPIENGGNYAGVPLVEDELLCCQNGDCYEWEVELLGDCEGTIGWCWWGYLNEDGTVDCNG
ncbi:hypothetical protein PPSIR1_19057 [Plesiocystis pacifica SIR-1]|uniref:Uncharacterized protein n=1 Tax=Plesiocystis pacifica SIR-1 TaxID=391625 RepID=A6GGM8_9BACT|nr:hypothetical protein [Plesiocystis pacifica]EDM74988.1 hypothetical protein PPSIR1_19057 [Plesiocystis pacifica SIR-1]